MMTFSASKLAEWPDNSDLWQEIRFSEGCATRKLPDKLRAIVLDNILSAEGSETNREEVTVVVRIGGQEHGENLPTPEHSLRRYGWDKTAQAGW